MLSARLRELLDAGVVEKDGSSQSTTRAPRA